MKKGWQMKTLGDVCHVYQPETISQKQMVAGEFRVYGANGQIGWHNQFNHEMAQLILGCRGSCGTVHFTEPRAWITGNAMVFQPKNGAIDLAFLAYGLKGGIEIGGAVTGAAQPQITRTSLMPIVISFPASIPEQQRIVGVLDEAFAGLATAEAIAEKNLQNASALFESFLQSVFTRPDDGWREKSFEDCIEDVKYTAKIQRKHFLREGKYPIVSQEAEFTNGYWNKASDVFKVRHPVVIFGDHTQVLKYIDFDFVLGADGVKILLPKPFLIPKFFFYHLRSVSLQSLGYSRHYRLLKEIQIGYPNTSTQATIVAKLDELHAEIQRLESIYQQKLAALNALKKSLLHQAFAGEL